MGFIEDKAALELARQENNRAKAAEAAAVLNMNSGLAGVIGKSAGYQTNGLTDQEANAIAQSNAIKQREYEAAAAAQYAKSKAYQADRKEAERFGDKVGPDGKYALVPAGDGRADWDSQVYGGDVSDPISLGLNKLQEYLINKPREAANAYTDNVDQGLAAKWMQSYKGNR